MFRPAGLSSDEDDEEGWDYHVNSNELSDLECDISENVAVSTCESDKIINPCSESLPIIKNDEEFIFPDNGNKTASENIDNKNLEDSFNLAPKPLQSIYAFSPFTSLSNLPQDSFPSTPRINSRQSSVQRGIGKSFDDFRISIIQGNIETVHRILNGGFSVDQILKSGWTGLMYACSSGKSAIVDLLLKNGANPNMHKDLFTALMAACASSQESENNLLECVNLLIDHKASVNISERHRMTPLMFASKEGHVLIVKRLIESKADINLRDNKGWSALSWACSKGHGNVMNLLLSNYADPSQVNNCGQKPSDIALNAGYLELSAVLDRASVTRMQDGTAKLENEDLQDLGTTKPSLEKNSLLDLSSKSLYNTTTLVDKCSQMEMILSGIDLEELIPLFKENKINLECFLQLTEADFVTMGIEEMGSRVKLLNAIKDMHKQTWETTSLHNLSNLKYMSLPDAVAIVKNVNQHLRFIHASIGYLRENIEAKPRALQLGQSPYSVGSLAELCGSSVNNIANLAQEVTFFKEHLDMMSERVEFCPADLIKSSNLERTRWRRHLLGSLILSTLLATSIYYVKPRIFEKLFSITPYPQKAVFVDL